jgi:hypothetical protein
MKKINVIRSSVRPFVAVALTVTVCAGFFMDKLEGEILKNAFLMITGFYFAERAALKNPNKDD